MLENVRAENPLISALNCENYWKKDGWFSWSGSSRWLQPAGANRDRRKLGELFAGCWPSARDDCGAWGNNL